MPKPIKTIKIIPRNLRKRDNFRLLWLEDGVIKDETVVSKESLIEIMRDIADALLKGGD